MIPKRHMKEFGHLRRTTREDLKTGALIIDFWESFDQDRDDNSYTVMPDENTLSYYLIMHVHGYESFKILTRVHSHGEISIDEGIRVEEATVGFLADDDTYLISEGF